MQQVRAESVGNGLYTVYVDNRRLEGLHTLQEVAEIYDKENFDGKSEHQTY